MNTATHGIRGFNSVWKKTPSGNLKMEMIKEGVKIILKKRDDKFEIHVMKLDHSKRVFATTVSGPRLVYWRNDGNPIRMSIRQAKDLVRRQMNQILEAMYEHECKRVDNTGSNIGRSDFLHDQPECNKTQENS